MNKQDTRRRRNTAKTANPTTGNFIAVDKIVVGRRTRCDMGDIEGLAASIAAIGLINPITVDEEGRLLAGSRRLAACKLLALKQVEVRTVRRSR